MSDKIKLPFNPDNMSVGDAKRAASALREVYDLHRNFGDLAEDFVARVGQLLEAFERN